MLYELELYRAARRERLACFRDSVGGLGELL